jgi:ABC-type phosphate transport system auxiliary subunit
MLNFRGVTNANPYTLNFDTSAINQNIGNVGTNQASATNKLMEGLGAAIKSFRDKSKLNKAKNQLLGTVDQERLKAIDAELEVLNKAKADLDAKVKVLEAKLRGAVPQGASIGNIASTASSSLNDTESV